MKQALQYTTLIAATSFAVQTGLAQNQSDSYKPSSSSATDSKLQSSQSQCLRMSDLLGSKVQSSQGDNLGDINDLVVHSDGKIQFAVLGIGGFLGIGEKLTPVPWNMLSADANRHFVLDADKQKLQSAPTLDKDQWTQLQSQQFMSRIYSHYGVQAPEAVGGTGSGILGTEQGTTGKSFPHDYKSHDKDSLDHDQDPLKEDTDKDNDTLK